MVTPIFEARPPTLLAVFPVPRNSVRALRFQESQIPAQGGSLAGKTEHDESRLFYVDADGRHGVGFLANESPNC